MRHYKNDIAIEELRKIIKYDPLTGEFTRIKTKSLKIKTPCKAGRINHLGYCVIGINKKIHLGHRIAWALHHNKWPDQDIDHINRNPSDNRITNLREAKPTENLLNRDKQKNNKSGYKNVSWSKTMNKWIVRMRVNKKDCIIGYYSDINEANKTAISVRKLIQNNFNFD